MKWSSSDGENRVIYLNIMLAGLHVNKFMYGGETCHYFFQLFQKISRRSEKNKVINLL